jgi:hypothetical protein
MRAIRSAHAQAPAKPVRILFIGNSLTFSWDAPERLAKLANAMGRPTEARSIAFPEFSLEDHWKDGRAAKELARGWDFVVLQQGPSIRPEERAALLDFSRRFAKIAREAGARPALFMTWPASDRLQDFSATIGAYRAAATAVDAMLAPVGEAWLRALGADKRLRLYTDRVNPAGLGADLALVTLYLTFFPAGPQEFDEAFVAKIARVLEIPRDRRDLLFDAATRAIDEPMALK